MTGRPDLVEPYVRGCAYAAGAGAWYPRADPQDMSRLPVDTWGCASTPAGVRLEFVGDAVAVDIDYRTATTEMGYRGDGAGRTFGLWRGGAPVDEVPADLGEGRVRLRGGGPPDERAIVYLPEGMKPIVLAIAGVGGDIAPAAAQPRWLAYGDSVAEGWVASGPAHAWPAVAGRAFGLDAVNFGYAGSARGELVSAEQLASLDAAVISITHGTNCWTRIPYSAALMAETTAAFIEIVRQGHPTTPIVVATPVVRPDAEASPNRLGATLADLRGAMARSVSARRQQGDRRLILLDGLAMLDPVHLADGIHPDDEGHRRLAQAIGGTVAAALAPQGVPSR